MMRADAIGGLLVALVLVASVCRAEDVPAAVGRITYGAHPQPGGAICTGVLVAPDMVLTAAHCVRDTVEHPEAIRFDAGWAGGKPTGLRKGAAVILAGEAGAPGVAGLVADVALVVLDAALPPDAFAPLPLAAPKGGPFSLISFDRSAPGQPQSAALCRPLAKPPGLLALDCPVVSGNSGAPLLERDGDGWRVVAVMVASAQGGPIRSWAVIPAAPLRLQIPLQDQKPGE
jgi:hypothetical protein